MSEDLFQECMESAPLFVRKGYCALLVIDEVAEANEDFVEKGVLDVARNAAPLPPCEIRQVEEPMLDLIEAPFRLAPRAVHRRILPRALAVVVFRARQKRDGPPRLGKEQAVDQMPVLERWGDPGVKAEPMAEQARSVDPAGTGKLYMLTEIVGGLPDRARLKPVAQGMAVTELVPVFEVKDKVGDNGQQGLGVSCLGLLEHPSKIVDIEKIVGVGKAHPRSARHRQAGVARAGDPRVLLMDVTHVFGVT